MWTKKRAAFLVIAGALSSTTSPAWCFLRRKSKPQVKRELKTRHRLAAACAGYVAGTVACTPLDVIKTRLQAGYRGSALGAALDVFRREGLPGFYRGLLPALLMAPGTVIQYTLYDTLRAAAVAPVTAATLAAIVDISIRTPMERIKTYTQAGLKKAPGSAGLSSLAQVALFWSGYRATLVRDIPYCIIYWLSYDILKSEKFFNVDAAQGAEKYKRGFSVGFLSGALAAAVVTPCDVVKTRIQTSPPGLTPAEAFRRVVLTDGTKALFAGLPTRLVRIPIYTGIVLATFETAKLYFGTIVDYEDS